MSAKRWAKERFFSSVGGIVRRAPKKTLGWWIEKHWPEDFLSELRWKFMRVRFRKAMRKRLRTEEDGVIAREVADELDWSIATLMLVNGTNTWIFKTIRFSKWVNTLNHTERDIQ